MIPDNEFLNDPLDEVQQPSLTWELDFEKGKVVGRIDELEAVKQAVFKVMQTDRFWHDIYSFDYGHEFVLLIGSSPLFIESEVTRMINEALMQDDRIQTITDMSINIAGDSMTISFRVVTDFGSFDMEVERLV